MLSDILYAKLCVNYRKQCVNVEEHKFYLIFGKQKDN